MSKQKWYNIYNNKSTGILKLYMYMNYLSNKKNLFIEAKDQFYKLVLSTGILKLYMN